MDKKIFFVLFAALFFLSFISAGQIDLNSEYAQEETLIAKVSGNFVDAITEENVLFYRQSVKVPVQFDIAKINEDYFIYALLKNKEPSNYSLRIENVRYFLGAEIIDEDIVGNFTILDETADFSINPGIIITEKDFILEVQNLQASSIEIESNETYSEPISLISGEIKDLTFDLGDETSFRFLELKSQNTIYKIPVFAFVESSGQTENQIQEQNETSSEVNVENETSSETNNGTSEDSNKTFFEQIKEKIIKSATTKTCAELNGTICTENQVCSGDSKYAKDAVCCTDVCEEKKKSNTGRIIGWSLIIVIILFLVWFFKKKYRKAKREVDLFKFPRRN